MAHRRSFAEWGWPLLAGILTGFAYRVVYMGDPDQPFNVMMASFVLLVPVAIGAVTVYVAERAARQSWFFYMWAPATASALFVIGTFAVLIEGLICTVLAAPLFAVVGAVAGLVTGAICRHTGRPHRKVLSIVALPLIFGAVEQHVPIPDRVDTVTASREIDASPEQVWRVLEAARDIRPEEIGDAWMYRIGVPLPLSAETVVSGGERVRHIEMGKQIAFDQVVEDWEPGRRVRYSYRFTPDSFPPRALDDHVRIGGHFFDLHDTEYTLEPTPRGARLTVRFRYRVSTHFNWYARPIARLLVGNFEEAALSFYARRAESRPARS